MGRLKVVILIVLFLALFALPAIAGPPPIQTSTAALCATTTTSTTTVPAVATTSSPPLLDNMVAMVKTHMVGIFGETRAGYMAALPSLISAALIQGQTLSPLPVVGKALTTSSTYFVAKSATFELQILIPRQLTGSEQLRPKSMASMMMISGVLT
jgi:hypothetical protein